MAHETFKTLIVANPQSANGALGRRWPQLQAIITLSFGPFDYRFTSKQRDAVRLTREALDQGYEMVVAMGGDGTISEVVDGFFTAGGPPNPEGVLGVLPFGTGGDFRKTIGAPKHITAGANSLVGRQIQPIDVGRLTYTDHQGREQLRHFVNIASFGIGGLVDELVNSSSKALGGRVSFAWATLRASLRYKAQRALLRLDDGPLEDLHLHEIAVANGKFFGGGMKIAPQAELDDGLFDVVTLAPMGLWDLALHGHRLYAGTHLELKGVSCRRARKVEARPADPTERILLDVDGEAPGMLPATFELLPEALKLKVPAP